MRPAWRGVELGTPPPPPPPPPPPLLACMHTGQGLDVNNKKRLSDLQLIADRLALGVGRERRKETPKGPEKRRALLGFLVVVGVVFYF